jgi:TetR/AcrR family transcriptional repressor of mexCD-oprJ operon
MMSLRSRPIGKNGREPAVAALGAEAENDKMMAALARALVDRPRASLQEVAAAVGVSKATLYRLCRTRGQLVERLVHHATTRITEAIEATHLGTAPPLTALERLIANNLEHRELTTFLSHYWWQAPPTAVGVEAGWDAALDAFFLRGQQAGIFRIDLAAPALTETFVALLLRLIDAERHRRLARGLSGRDRARVSARRRSLSAHDARATQ